MADQEKARRQRVPGPLDGAPTQEERLGPAPEQHSTSRMAGNDRERVQHAAHLLQTRTASDSAKVKTLPMRGAMDLERMRVELEAARARLVGPFADIPTGREYDSPPDDTEEEAFDALEKAYNAAFMMAAPASAENAEQTEGEIDQLPHADAKLRTPSEGRTAVEHSSFARYQIDSAAGRAHTVLTSLKKELATDKSVQEAEGAQQVGTLKSLCLSTLKQQTKGANQVESQQAKASLSETKNYTSSRKKGMGESSRALTDSFAGSSTPADSIKSSRDTTTERDDDLSSVVATASLASKSSTEVMSATASVPQSPKASPMDKSSEASLVSTPEMKKESPHSDLVTMTPSATRQVSATNDDRQALNEFLVAELQIYCSKLLHQEFKQERASDTSDAAQITAHQLFRDHQRALMDFDAEWTRSHSESYQAYPPSSHEESSGLPRTSFNCNPFQSNKSGPEVPSEWPTLLKQVKASSTRPDCQAAMGMPQEWQGREDCGPLFATHKSGLNGLVVTAESGDSERHQIATFMAQMTAFQNTSAFHVVVSSSSDLTRWEKALASQPQIQLYPYWGGKGDRNNLLQLLSNGYFSGRSASAHVLLTSYEVFVEDIATLSSLQCQLSVTDIPGAEREQVAPIWPHLLSLRCRQRLLFCQRDFKADVRKLLHFLVPDVFDSRRKLLAWNCAAFRTEQIRAMYDIVQAFILISDAEAAKSFIGKVASLTEETSRHERAALDALDKQLMLKPVHPAISASVRRLVKKNKLNLAVRRAMDDTDESQVSAQSLKKRRSNDGMSRMRQRISRCGKCAGCLAEDCLVCDHCQDMKKYGGPGLRKQSCKNRKCSNPKTWGLARRKRRRGKYAEVEDDQDAAEEVDSVKDYSELDDSMVTYSTMESDGDSVYTASLSNAGAADSDSEATGSSRFSDATVGSPRDQPLDSDASLGRVMRCGECTGCRTPDCTKCRYCLDMPKHGGPGLRNQSCKDRKCIAPRIVKQVQDTDDQYVDEQGNVVCSGVSGEDFPGWYKAPDASESPPFWGVVTATPRVGERSAMLTLTQECELFVEPRLVFVCKHCVARLSSKALLDFHHRVEHSLPPEPPVTTVEREASRLFLHPICQNAMISVQLKQQDRSQRSSPLGYAKLEGRDFEYYLVQPYIVLGRMDSRWRALYKRLGFRDLKGLPGGQVDCHVGNDDQIASTHAVISWDARIGSFVIACLSLRCAISVNGRLVTSSSPPVSLRSRNLVQIGSSIFYFLLPKATTGAKPSVADDLAAHTSTRGKAMPREDVRVWMQTAVEKRRKRQQSE